MGKIGLITYHASHNIGSLLQTYAMLNIIKKRYSQNVEIINFSSKKQQQLYSFYYKNSSLNGIAKNMLIGVLFPFFKKRYDDFSNFISSYFPLSGPLLSTTSEVDELVNKYDFLVCGSDQIWNLACVDFDDAYFLPFKKNKKKIAYAPSLGGRNILKAQVDLRKYKVFLNDFDHISVREKNGVKWLSQLTNKKISLVPDPTLLLNCDFWDTLADKKTYKDKYIFFYGSPYYLDTFRVLGEVSRRYNMPVVVFDHKSWLFKGNLIRGLKVADSASPNSYLNLIKNAEFVITTSFHGTIFSTIFRKNFWSITFKGTNPDDDRIDFLLEQLGFEDRKKYFEEVHAVDLTKPVFYKKYEERIEQLQEVGLSFLDCAFCG